MAKRLAIILVACSLIVCALPTRHVQAVSPCTLCILEVQTRGVNGEEDQDFVIVANISANKVTTSGIQLRYLNHEGLLANSLGIGSFDAGQVKIYASKTLAEANGNVTGTLEFGIFSGSGSLQIARGSGSTGVVYDTVGWGDANTRESVSAPAAAAGTTLARKRMNGVSQDTDNNNLDFEVNPLTCRAVEISEVQPFVADPNGQTIDAWVELAGVSETRGDCMLVTKAGDVYSIPAADLPISGEAAVINRGMDTDNEIVPLHLGETSGRLWLGGRSAYADNTGLPIQSPVVSIAYSNLENGQSWAHVGQVWRRTFSPTPGEPNIFQPSAIVLDDDPAACETVRISELLPNPAGEDAGHEWVELTNESEAPAALGHCQLSVAGEVYRFLSDDVLGAQEWRAFYELYDNNEQPKALALRNSGMVLVALERLRADGVAETIQSFVYTDAPEGQSWSRFSDGWRWQMVPTANLDNTTAPATDTSSDPTEFPATENLPPSGSALAHEVGNTVSITELLPNPAAPGTDDNDEYVELFNTGDTPMDLSGYTVQTGNNFSYSFTFTDQVIPANGYLVVTSGNSSLSLANSAGKARLVGADGTISSETVPYADAPEGHAWALLDGAWKWTASPTAGAANVFKAPVLTALSKSKTGSTPKASGSVKSANKTNTSTPKQPKTSSASTTKPSEIAAQAATTVTPLHPLVLAVVGGLGVLYAAYEYRQDVANKLYQLRRNRSHRREDRAPAQGRGTD